MELLSYFFLAGLIIGSFLNVVIIRLAEDETLLGRSVCRNCRKEIAWYDNVPVLSYLLLKGRCRWCHAKISLQYPLVEILTASLYVFVGALFFDIAEPVTWLTTVWLLLLLPVLLAIFVHDVRSMEIPVNLLVVGVILTLFFLVVEYFLFQGNVAFWETHLWSSILGGALVTLFFYALVFFSQETWMGWGDVWLGLLVGLGTGLSHAFIMLTLSFALGAGVGVALLFFKKKELSTQVPFAPFLISGFLLILLLQKVQPVWLRFLQW